MAQTFLKAKCKVTGKLFGLTIDNKDGRPYIRDFVPLEQEAYDALSPEYKVDPHIEVASTLLPCKWCGTRKFGSCSCSRSRKTCNKNDKYDYQCAFCDQMEFDYSGGKGKGGPYSKWVGVSNIPAAAFDKHGNPQGDEFDLAKDGSMNGFDVIIINSDTREHTECPFVMNTLKKKGFRAYWYNCFEYSNTLPDINTFINMINSNKAQVWIISYTSVYIPEPYINAIIDAYKKGHGLYLWGDNDPFHAEVNCFLNKIYGQGNLMAGNYYGDKVISIRKNNYGPGIILGHPIATGIQNFYEGITIASIRLIQNLKPLVYDSNNGIVTVYDDSNGRRLLVDGGFTRMFVATDKAGTDRFLDNCAVWLANVEKWGYKDLKEFK